MNNFYAIHFRGLVHYRQFDQEWQAWDFVLSMPDGNPSKVKVQKL